MSYNTTELRFVMETYAGLGESVGYQSIGEVINSSWNKLFDFDFPIFDETYRKVLCTKIIKHYYTRSIGAETVGRFKLFLDSKMNEIMPYYNKLYQSELIEFNPLYDVDISRSHKTTGESQSNTTGNGSVNENSSGSSYDLFSDTPQGGLSGVDTETYLTTAEKVTNSNTGSTTSSNKSNQTVNTTEDYLETVSGKQGSGSYSDMLLKYRETFINIDVMIIKELSGLFYGLYYED